MSLSSVRAKRTNLRSEGKSSQASLAGQKELNSLGSKQGLRLRSMNHRNTPSPKTLSVENVGKKIVEIYRDQDENSNPPQESLEPVQIKSLSSTPRGPFLKQVSSKKAAVTQVQETIEKAVQVDHADFVIEQDIVKSEDEELSVDYYKKLAEERLRETENLSDQLNNTRHDLEEMTTVNTTLCEENEKLVKKCEDYEEQMEYLVGVIEKAGLTDDEEEAPRSSTQ